MAPGPSEAWGSAFFDFPPADGHVAPGGTTPDSWRLLFIAKHADAHVFQGLLSSCGPGRDWVLESAPRARLRLDEARVQPAALQHTGSALSKRGLLPVQLTVDFASAEWLATLAGVLTGPGQCIVSLSLRSVLPGHADVPDVTVLLSDLAVACPRLASLQLDACLAALPAPNAAPNLTQLSVSFPRPDWYNEEAADRFFSSIAPYVQQLTSLIIPAHTVLWSRILSAQQPTHTLTTLVTESELDDELLSLLLSSAPALAHLRGGEVTIEGQGHATRTWGVNRLEGVFANPWALSCLPVNEAGRVHVQHTGRDLVRVHVHDLEDIDDRPAAFSFACKTVSLHHLDPVPEADWAAALCDALERCGRLFAPGTILDLSVAMYWDAPVMDIAAAAHNNPLSLMLPDWYVCALTDNLLAVLLATPEHRKDDYLHVEGLSLQSDEHMERACLWKDIEVEGGADVASLVRLPWSEARPSVSCKTVHIRTVPTEAQLERLRRMRVRFDRIFVHRPKPGTDGARTRLVQFMDTVRAFTGVSEYAYEVRLIGWSMKEHTMEALKHLPAWVKQLNFAKCKDWPLQPAAYRRLASYVPNSVRTWVLGDISAEIRSEIITGLQMQGVAVSLPDEPQADDSGGAQAVQTALRPLSARTAKRTVELRRSAEKEWCDEQSESESDTDSSGEESESSGSSSEEKSESSSDESESTDSSSSDEKSESDSGTSCDGDDRGQLW